MTQEVSFYKDSERIFGTLVLPEGRKPYPGVILFHGLTSNEKNYIPIAQKLGESGIAALTVSVRGHGTSQGDFKTLTIRDGFADGLATFDFFVQQDFLDDKRIGICGSSLGAAIAAMISKERKVESLILRVPATYTSLMIDMTYPQIMSEEKSIFQNNENPSDTPPVKALEDFKGSILVITSEHDEIIPEKIPAAYLSMAKVAKKKELRAILGAAHSLSLSGDRQRQQFVDWAIEWFKETLVDP